MRGNKSVKGWLARIEGEIFRAILEGQSAAGLGGSAAEIGVHHGKAFIALCLGLAAGERGYCIDIFEQQELNLDSSGRGERETFEGNLKRFGVDMARVTVDPRSSELVTADDIVSAAGPVRFFSVDGGHWLEIVENDLKLAEAVLADHGVIAIDDFHRAEWPDVSPGYFTWYAGRKKALVPFAIGFNKLYLCMEDRVDFYQQLLVASDFVSRFQMKRVTFQGFWIPVYQGYIYPELAMKKKVKLALATFLPTLYARVAKRQSFR